MRFMQIACQGFSFIVLHNHDEKKITMQHCEDQEITCTLTTGNLLIFMLLVGLLTTSYFVLFCTMSEMFWPTSLC